MKKLLSIVSESFRFRNVPEDVLSAESRLPVEELTQIQEAFRTNYKEGWVLSYQEFTQWNGLLTLTGDFSRAFCQALDHGKTNSVHYFDFVRSLDASLHSKMFSLASTLIQSPDGLHCFLENCIKWNSPSQTNFSIEVNSLVQGVGIIDNHLRLDALKDWFEKFPVFLRSLDSILHGFKVNPSRVDFFPKPKLVGWDPNYCLLSEVFAWVLASNLRTNWRQSWELIFGSYKDGNSFTTFLSKIRNRGVTLLVFQDENEHLFGGFASSPWEPNGRYYGDYSSFLFTLLPTFQIYKPSGSNENFQWCGEKFKELPNGVGFGGQVGFFSLFLNPDFESGMSHKTVTFGSPSLSSQPKFKLRQVECWLIERSEDDLLKDLPQSSVLDRFKEDQQVMALIGQKRYSEGYRD